MFFYIEHMHIVYLIYGCVIYAHSSTHASHNNVPILFKGVSENLARKHHAVEDMPIRWPNECRLYPCTYIL